MKIIDVLIVGAGPAGIGALTYLSRSKASYLWVDKGAPGGKLLNIADISNCPGFLPQNGFSLARNLLKPLEDKGIYPQYGEVSDIKKENNLFYVSINNEIQAFKSVLICTGLSYLAKIKGEKEYLGKGISYCATCDGSLYKDKIVALEGEGPRSYEEALYLLDLVKELHLFYKGETFYLETPKSNKLILHPYSIVREVVGDDKKVTKIIYNEKGEKQELAINAFFPLNNEKLNNSFFSSLSIEEKNGFLVVNDDMMTSLPGVFAAGDLINKPLKQVITALSDGALASRGILSYLRGLKDE